MWVFFMYNVKNFITKLDWFRKIFDTSQLIFNLDNGRSFDFDLLLSTFGFFLPNRLNFKVMFVGFDFHYNKKLKNRKLNGNF